MNKILSLFNDLQQGECWIGLNFSQVLGRIDATQALHKPSDTHNCIWQLVNHLIYWRETVMIRMKGEDAHPPQPDFSLPADTSEAGWRQTLADFDTCFHRLQEALARFPEAKLDEPSPKAGQTYYQLLMGCLQHDSYHFGQIVLLAK